jgi:photosystem II stability/assembly factor-like uncharacterized protein
MPSEITTLEGCAPSGIYSFGSRSLTLFETCFDGIYVNSPRVYLYHTDNNGQAWQITPIRASLRSLPSASEIFGPEMVMISALIGWKISRSDDVHGTLDHTLDGGKTWTVIHALPLPGSASSATCADAISDFDFVDPDTVWAVDCTGTLEITHDSGRTWQQLKPKLSF